MGTYSLNKSALTLKFLVILSLLLSVVLILMRLSSWAFDFCHNLSEKRKFSLLSQGEVSNIAQWLPVRFVKNEATAVLLKMQVVVYSLPCIHQLEHLFFKWKVCLESLNPYPTHNPCFLSGLQAIHVYVSGSSWFL